MINFGCDYLEGMHPEILKRLEETNFVQQPGYGDDDYSNNARKLIHKYLNYEDCDIYFIPGGTQTNFLTIKASLMPYHGVISADTGHIAGHETGAVESSGHKVLTVSNIGGKISAEQIKQTMISHINSETRHHEVRPGMVYISHPAENGALYSLNELKEISKVCRDYNLKLFVDGARLGYALASYKNDVTLEDLAKLTDVFYIGGTKCGAAFGEALVVINTQLRHHFKYNIKQNGALFAKGRFLGLQFETLFTDNLYEKICKPAIDFALKIKKSFVENGFELFSDSYTNQQFFILTNEQVNKLKQNFGFEIRKDMGDKKAIRICSSWATKSENVDLLLDFVKQL